MGVTPVNFDYLEFTKVEICMDIHKSAKQLPYLFYYSLSVLFVGMGLMPVLPLYSAELGATSTTIGIFLSVIYLSFTASTLLTGWLSIRLGRKRLFILTAVLGSPALFLMGQVVSFWQLLVLAAIVWFCGGMCMALVNIFTGLYATPEYRGKWFSLISLASPIGAIIGSLSVGYLIEWRGYPLMFAALSILWVIYPVVAFIKLEDISTDLSRPVEINSPSQFSIGREHMPLILLMGAILFSMLTINVGRLGLPLTMTALEYTASAVTTAHVVAGMVTLPFAYFLGTLSDRFGRKNILILGYMLAAGGVLVLIRAEQAWEFWISASMTLVALTVSGSVASAFATDLLAPDILVRVLPWFTAVGSMAGILGFAGAGYVIESIGIIPLLGLSAVLALVASSLIFPLHCEKQIASLFEPGWTCDISMRSTR
jgi:MFS transporter, DHA1 family, multidrug resistance protein